MAKTSLTDTQRAILIAACKRKDRRVFPIVIPGLNGGAVTAVLKSLVKNNFVQEVPTSGDDHVWRKGDDGAPLTLRATAAAEKTVAVRKTASGALRAKGTAAPRRNRDTKQAKVIVMLKRPSGATVEQIIKATDWQPHTVRGFFAGALKKRLGIEVTSEKEVGGKRVYRIGS
jgi:hypothetical protein